MTRRLRLVGEAVLAGLALGEAAKNSTLHLGIGVVWAIVAAFVGLKGIQYVAKVATYLPIIPLVILLVLAGKTLSGVGSFKPEMLAGGAEVVGLSSLDVLLFAIANIVGFFATAGAAGVDIASSNRDSKDVQLGGLAGVAGATIFTGCLALLIVAGAYGSGMMAGKSVELDPTKLMDTIMGPQVTKIFWLLLAIAAFPPACFSSLIAANSMKNTLPKVNPFVSVGIGTAASIALVLSGQAGDAAKMFGIIGASFGPICGAMVAEGRAGDVGAEDLALKELDGRVRQPHAELADRVRLLGGDASGIGDQGRDRGAKGWVEFAHLAGSGEVLVGSGPAPPVKGRALGNFSQGIDCKA